MNIYTSFVYLFFSLKEISFYIVRHNNNKTCTSVKKAGKYSILMWGNVCWYEFFRTVKGQICGFSKKKATGASDVLQTRDLMNSRLVTAPKPAEPKEWRWTIISRAVRCQVIIQPSLPPPSARRITSELFKLQYFVCLFGRVNLYTRTVCAKSDISKVFS